ncbi:hypothetical protein GT034_12245 [Streptomyces sp. SID2563]|uniref:hypothetical protein n=1 Tax=Streptomyces sp. SID2563 TaxID=2690255 RepID=UPI0013680EC4|nr:hypothetical protein [Streptomyces sp. SID2563]MYW09116.1 hypothetical protein [Streptomyces sp. SID2563]
MTYLLTVVKVQEPGAPDNAARAAVHCEAHPRSFVTPGRHVRIALTVQADQGAPHAYGYLDEDSVVAAADVVAVEGAEYSATRRHYRVRADAGGATTAVLTLLVRPGTTEPVLRPAIGAAIPGRDPRKLLRAEPQAQEGVRIRGFFAPGRALPIAPHAAHTPALLDVRAGLPAGTTLIGHGQPRNGRVSVTPEGALLFEAAPGAMGYDHFGYTVQSPTGERADGRVVVHIGDLAETPGLLTPPGPDGSGTTAHAPWTQAQITGPLPWPAASLSG